MASYKMDDIFVYRINGEDKDGQPQGSFFATGYVPAALRRLAMTGVKCRTVSTAV